MNKLVACIYEAHTVVALVLLQNDYAGGDGCAKEKILRKLNDSVHIVVAYQILADLLLSSSTVEHTGKLNNGSCAFG